MEKYPASLSFAPFLTQPTPPASSRSIKSFNSPMKQFANMMAYYNGNYEGDITMFQTDNMRRDATPSNVNTNSNNPNNDISNFDDDDEIGDIGDYITTDTESSLDDVRKQARVSRRQHQKHNYETEMPIKMSTTKEMMEKNDATEDILKKRKANLNQLQNIYPTFIYVYYNMIMQNIMVNVNKYLEKYPALKAFRKYFELLGTIVVWFLHIIMLVLQRLSKSSVAILKGRTLMRKASRRLLWSMTLAKCNDFPLFTLFLCCIPILFVITICGFLLSLYCILKDNIIRGVRFMRHRISDF